MPRRMQRNDVDVILYGDSAPPFTVANPPGSMALNERTGVLYIRRQDMQAVPASGAGRMVKLTGTSPNEGASGTIAHGLADRAKIIGAQVLVSNNTGNRIPPGFTSVGNHEFDYFIDSTNVHIYCISGNSSSIANNAVTVLITYEE